jgi:D-proline reductase (dithiol) PrdB
MPFQWMEFARELVAPRPYPDVPNFDPPSRTPLRRPIEDSTIAVVTSLGVYDRDDEPLRPNDLSFRFIPRETPLAHLRIGHHTPIRLWAELDLNVAYPRDRLVELEAEGVFRRLAPHAVSLVGSNSRYSTLLRWAFPPPALSWSRSVNGRQAITIRFRR